MKPRGGVHQKANAYCMIAVLLFGSGFCPIQNALADRIRLKNGRTIDGTIIRRSSGSTLIDIGTSTMQISDNDVLEIFVSIAFEQLQQLREEVKLGLYEHARALASQIKRSDLSPSP